MADNELSNLSIFSTEVQSAPFEFYRLAREKCPVYQLPENGFYMLSRYDDVYEASQDWTTFSSQQQRIEVLQGKDARILLDILKERGWEHLPTLQRVDPPQHARYRKILDRALNIKQVRNLSGRIEGLAHALIDSFIDRGECDFPEEFAFPLPGIIIAELIGMTSEEWPLYRKWANAILSYSMQKLTPDELRAAAEIELEMQHAVAAILEDRRRNPREDLMTGLVTAYEDEEPLSMHELQSVMHQLISGGYDTVPNAMSHIMLRLIEHPEMVERLRNDRGLTRNFIDECLRHEGPVQAHIRRVTQDVTLHGVTMPAGSFCMLRWGATGRDESKFPDPDTLIPERENAVRHLGFGAGPHVCPGMMLARQELTIGVNVLLERLDDFKLARPLPSPTHRPSVVLHQLRELNISFRKRR